MKTNRAFTEEELKEMGTRVLDLAFKAIDEGKKDKVKKLCQQLYDESLSIHDTYLHWVTGFMSAIYRHYGSDVLEEMARDVFSISIDKAIKAFGKADFRGKVKMMAQGMRGHFQPLTIEEDDEKAVVTMKPCGAGQRLLEQGAYGPPYNFALIREPHRITWGKANFPMYCIHAPIFEMLSIEKAGYPVYLFCPAEDVATASCQFHIYKDPKSIPEEVYTKVGMKKPKI
jgi:hypothetical protein